MLNSAEYLGVGKLCLGEVLDQGKLVVLAELYEVGCGVLNTTIKLK